MEVSVMGKALGNLHVRTEFANRESKLFYSSIRNKTDKKTLFCRRNNNNNNNDSVSFISYNSRWRKLQLRFSSRAAAIVDHSQHVRSDKFPSRRSSGRPISPDGVRLFVGLPLDTVSDSKSVKHARAVAAGLKALKLLGVDGVELPVWWGVAEKEAMGKYDWSAYLAVAEMVKAIGLKLHVSLCFHASKQTKIPLPDWVCQIGESNSSIYYTDRAGQQFKECLSLAVDELPVLDGKTPIQVYSEFCESFKSTFKPLMGSTITGITMGLGPDGELRYPSDQQSKSSRVLGAGEFQCWDKNMLSLLKQHAEATGNPLWGLGGPHDAPRYDESPTSGDFFKDHGGSWESPYGDFFLSWYSSQLLSHGNHLLSLASSTFSKAGVGVYGKIPLIHSWYKTRSHSSELTAGFYNTDNRDGYSAVAEMFAKNLCKIILPGMDLSDDHQPRDSLSSPELLLAQIRAACREHGVGVSGQNSSESGVPGGFEQIKKYLLGDYVVELFTYQRMGAYFFSPEHFPSFSEFVRNLVQPELHSDDLPAEEEEIIESGHKNADASIHVQAA